MSAYWDILRELFANRSQKLLLLASVFALSFSLTVIWATIGLMNGFESTLLLATKRGGGEIYAHSLQSFFTQEKLQALQQQYQKDFDFVAVRQLEGFVSAHDKAQGIILKGLGDNYQKILPGVLNIKLNELIISPVLAKELGIKIGDEIALILAKGGEQFSSLPAIHRLRVGQFFSHGVHEKDAHYVYALGSTIFSLIGIAPKYNSIELASKKEVRDIAYIKKWEQVLNLREGSHWNFYPFWYNYRSLLDSVKMQKQLIVVILQVIVLVALFNVTAFIIYIRRKKALDFLLLRVLGLSARGVLALWLFFVLLLWALACLFAGIFLTILNYIILPWIDLPGDIYYLTHLQLKLGLSDIAWVALLLLLWLIVVVSIWFYWNPTKSVLQELREEVV